MTTHSEKLATASDPSTDSAILADLAKSKHPAIRRALAANPNTPGRLFRSLWSEHPQALLENPIFDLWDFTGTPPYQRQHPDESALIRLYNDLRASNSEIPARFFGGDKLRDIVGRCAANHDSEIFKFIPFEPDPRLRLALVAHAPRRTLFQFFETLAPDPVWKILASDPDPAVRLGLAALLRSAPSRSNPTRPAIAEAAFLLAEDSRPEMILELAFCHFLPAELAEKFSRSPDPDVRSALASCRNATEATLRRLATDSEEQVRRSIAKKATLPQVLELLLRDPSESVRLALAENHELPPELLARFSLRDTPEVLTTVYSHPKADADLRTRILSNSRRASCNILLRAKVRPTQGFYSRIKHLLSPETLAGIPDLTHIAPAIIEDLSRSEHPCVRLAVAKRLRHRATTSTKLNIEIANRFAKDPFSDVRYEICTDPRLEAEATAALFSDPDPRIRKKSAAAVLDYLVKRRNDHSLSIYAIIHRAKSPLLTRLALDPDHAVRFEIAKCPEAPPEALSILFDDPVPHIAEAARKHTRWPYGVLLDLADSLAKRLESLRQGHTTPNSRAIAHLAKSPNPFLRHLVARCHRTPSSLLEKLAADSHPHIRETAALTLNKRRRK